MKVAILAPFRGNFSIGTVKYLTEVASRLRQRKEIECVMVICPHGALDSDCHFGVDVRVVPETDYRRGFRAMSKMVEVGGFDVALSMTARHIKLQECPIVTMVQNVEPIEVPTYNMPFMWRARLWALRLEYASACRQARRVLALSKHTKDLLCRRFAISPHIVDVVYHGFDPKELVCSRKPDLNIQEKDFIFSAGSIVPYRGYEDILHALPRVQANLGDAPSVVFVGNAGGHPLTYKRRLKELARSLNVEDRVIWAGQLRREEMAWCFQNAKLFIQTSRAEACPNIVLEAMGHACMAVSCDHPPMPEFFQDTALFYRTGDSCALAEKITMALRMNQAEAETWQMKAKLRSSYFSWDKCVDETLGVLQRAIKGNQER